MRLKVGDPVVLNSGSPQLRVEERLPGAPAGIGERSDREVPYVRVSWRGRRGLRLECWLPEVCVRLL